MSDADLPSAMPPAASPRVPGAPDPDVEWGASTVDVLSAALRADAADTDTFFQVLAAKLADALGERVRLERGGGRIRKDPRVKRVEVRLGDELLQAERDGGSVRCSVKREVRGIVLRTEQVALDQWLAALAAKLSEEAGRSAATRAALEGLLG